VNTIKPATADVVRVSRRPTPEHLRRARLRAQRLAPPERDDGSTAAAAVAPVVGLQAQDEAAAALGVRARSRGLTADDVERARHDDATLVRTWCMRGTLHLVAVEDVAWLLSVFGPVYVHRGRRRLADLGFDDEAAADAVDAICDAIAAEGPLTREEITGVLVDAGYDFDPDGQGTYHLVRRAGLLGEVCQVAPVAGEQAYGLLAEWAPIDDPPDRDDALGELARRYVDGYGPVSLADFAAWSGLPMADVRAGWAVALDDAVAFDADGDAPTYTSTDLDDLDSPAPLRLLPAYDAYLLGYEDRDHAVDEGHASLVHPGGGIIRRAVVEDGRAVATWSLDRSRSTPLLEVDPFDGLSTDALDALQAEVADVGRFLGIEVELRLAG